MDSNGPLPACGWAQDPGKAVKKLVGGPERGPPVIWTNPRGCKQLPFMEKGNGHATSDPWFSG